MTPLETLAAVLVVVGTFFGFVATVGIIRLPDLYSRLHAASKSDTLGSVLSLAGIALVLGLGTESLKLVFLLVFLFVTSPTAAHAIARAAKEQEVEPAGDELEGEE
ncbi:multicomponent Na+:H+ antiporter subunit G [Haloplanus vescus]|uniref:Multicomponent Na+:H+ antiporter subunit G n=1 Tax=Haloplanus vescus TaxID=555874 RepID=A0A1H3W203_9EURY|nr:monovalent cation/H(+) antiporter subunit G [Haloplanus vescus]SDZ81083.1 multicomponent Na+:H+ antiporter subunit G [Haloplanus vescus]